MRTLQSYLFTCILLTGISHAQTVIPAGDVSGTWSTAGSPYHILGDIAIPNDSTLTIEPGVVVDFQGHYQLSVNGRLLALGTETDTITFTIHDTTGFSNPQIPEGGWHGIRFSWTPQTNDSSKIVYCKLQYGKALGSLPNNLGGALFADHWSKLVVSHCLIADNLASYNGGGIYLYYSSPTIAGNTISHNWATGGGGISCADGSNPHMANNILANNSAERGGGISFFADNPVLTNTMIENNNATTDGGGILILGNSSPVLQNVTLKGNTSNWGAAIHSFCSDLTIDSSSFVDNVGDAIVYDCSDTIPYTRQLHVAHSLFTNHSAASSGMGIRASQEDSSRVNVTVDKCVFADNRAFCGLQFEGNSLSFTLDCSTFSRNEAINRPAAAVFMNGCKGTVSNCLFDSNSAITGGGYYYYGTVGVALGAGVDFVNCTFAANSASHAAALAVARGGIASTTNSIFWGNGAHQIALDTVLGQGGALTVNYCNVQGGEDSVYFTGSPSTLIWGTGNIHQDPLFLDPLNSDYHLQSTSPCIGAAIDTLEIGGIMHCCPAIDIEGNPRPNPPGTMPDMGAFESSEGGLGVEENDAVRPTVYALSQNYPNPFNPSTTIKFELPRTSHVSLTVYDMLGRQVSALVNEKRDAGVHDVKFDGSSLASGVYLYRLTAGNFVQTRKLVLLK
jgi:parallel beta-helix repeat protein